MQAAPPNGSPAAAARPRRARLRARVAGWVLLFLVNALLLEGVARVIELVAPPLEVDRHFGLLPQSRLFVPSKDDGDVLVTAPGKAASKQRFRRTKAAGALRIVALGGSSVHEAQSELEALTERLARTLGDRVTGVELINAGVDSYGSQRLLIVLSEVLEYEPDLVILYTGHNEFQERRLLDLTEAGRPGVGAVLDHLAAFRVVRDLMLIHRLEGLLARSDVRPADDEPNIREAERHRFSAEEGAARMAAFERHLRRMVSLCAERNVPLIMASIPSNYIAPGIALGANADWSGVRSLLDAKRYAEALALGRRLLAAMPGRKQASDQENAILRRVATEAGLPFADVLGGVVAAEPHGVPGETLFRDHCHLGGKGRRLWLEIVFPVVEDVARRVLAGRGRGP